MKTKMSHRFLSLFAAVLVVFSMLSSVAFASEIQPRIPTCPECGGDTYYQDGEVEFGPITLCPEHRVNCPQAIIYRYAVCFSCGAATRVSVLKTGYWCPQAKGGYHW